MKILEIPVTKFVPTINEVICNNIISPTNQELVDGDIEEVLSKYILDIGIGEEVIQRNFLVVMGEVLIVLRNNWIDEEAESFFLEELSEKLQEYVIDNPYM